MNTKSHPTLCRALLCLLVAALAGCSRLPAQATATGPLTLPPAQAAATDTPAQGLTSGDYWPTKAWRTSSPEEQGMDSDKLAQMLDAIQEQKLGFHGLLVIRNGYIVSETYFGSYQQDTRHELYSVTKSFVSTLIGIALDKGYIDSTGQRVVDFFPGETFASLDEQKRAMTLEDVLTMRTGLDWDEGDTAYQSLYTSPDWVQYMLDLPMAAAPGSQFNYCSGCSHLLIAILKQATDTNPRDFAEKNLFKPLGIDNLR